MTHKDYTPRAQRKHRFIEAFKENGMILYACRKAGISRTTYYRWLARDRAFENSIIDAFVGVYENPSKKAVLDELPEHKRNAMHCAMQY